MLEESFDHGLDDWWVEGGVKTWVEDGRLYVDADPETPEAGPYVATVWYRHEMPGDLRIEFDAHVVSSSIDANNINFFLNYTDPSGLSLYETRSSREDAAYPKYHDLNGHIVTFLNDYRAENGRLEDGSTSARIRLRRCPGFELMSEVFNGKCEAGVTYRCKIEKKGKTLSFYIDGVEILSAEDEREPLGPGYIGMRTFRTFMWWDNIKVTEI
ncbi:DUF1961 family protein [Ruficoccus amylovorans]|uniref:DUF1961 family protein n=1 Tax=Ruficoccus amylovorans TaxID=1804625 RepID=A0A842HGC3_9BACT|nr:DUF1961 family protein [Ruficoccus amylovorans]MBC2595735.1 DUF1961 family protein [Ruficoccus amylovorans]